MMLIYRNTFRFCNEVRTSKFGRRVRLKVSECWILISNDRKFVAPFRVNVSIEALRNRSCEKTLKTVLPTRY